MAAEGSDSFWVQMKNEYYDTRARDKATRAPKRDDLEALGLSDVAEEVLPTPSIALKECAFDERGHSRERRNLPA